MYSFRIAHLICMQGQVYLLYTNVGDVNELVNGVKSNKDWGVTESIWVFSQAALVEGQREIHLLSPGSWKKLGPLHTAPDPLGSVAFIV